MDDQRRGRDARSFERGALTALDLSFLRRFLRRARLVRENGNGVP